MRFVVLLAVTLLAACSLNPKHLKLDKYKAEPIVIQSNYQAVLKNILEGWDKCMSIGIPGLGMPSKELRHYPDLKEAEIIMASRGINTFLTTIVQIKAIDDNQTSLTVYDRFGADLRIKDYKQFANGDLSCDFKRD